LVVVDEEHDVSFKQQDGFRYSGRDVAIKRASLLGVPVVLGSATPSLESLGNVERGRYVHLLLRERAGGASLPQVRVVDVRGKPLVDGVCHVLLKAIKVELEAGNQVLLFLNRRGFSPVILCHDCGVGFSCEQCDAKLVFHYYAQHLRCHHCDRVYPFPSKCGECRSEKLVTVGLGTERVEVALKAQFPDFPVVRVDRDSTSKKGSLQSVLDDVASGSAQILVGTQMLAKGHHFPDVTLVGILNGDSGFLSADFRGSERMGQLICQVSGRAGRAEKPGKVFIQSYHPENPLLKCLVTEGYSVFDGQYLFYGVREFGMSAIMNGFALHGGFIPYGGTFLIFMEYARNAVRIVMLCVWLL